MGASKVWGLSEEPDALGNLDAHGRTTHPLIRVGIDRISAVRRMSDEDLLCIRHFGPWSLADLRAAIARYDSTARGGEEHVALGPVRYGGYLLERVFRARADRWRKETRLSSSPTDMFLHPAYQQIIELGPDVLSLLLKELQDRPNHWFMALVSISGVDPAADCDGFDEAVEAWIQWGRDRGYLA